MNNLIIRKLIVDEHNELFDAQGMKYMEFKSNFNAIRTYCSLILEDCPDKFKEGNLLEQQLSELLKNGIKHGNKCNPAKKIKVWYDLRKRARFIVEDEGDGFICLDAWNDFYRSRQEALFAAMEFWNGGMIYNEARNKIGVVRWFYDG